MDANENNVGTVQCALWFDSERASDYACPQGNRIATKLFSRLLKMQLECDEISPRSVYGLGYYNASVYQIEVAAHELRRARAIVAAVAESHSDAAKVWVIASEPNGASDGTILIEGETGELTAENITAFRYLMQEAGDAEREIQAHMRAVIERKKRELGEE